MIDIYPCVNLKFGYFQLLVLHHYDFRISAAEIMEEIVGIKHFSTIKILSCEQIKVCLKGKVVSRAYPSIIS